MKVNSIYQNFDANTMEIRFETREDLNAAYNSIVNETEPNKPELADYNFAIETLMFTGHKIHAIKLVRTVSGMGLLESKQYVEGLPVNTDL